MFRGEYQCLKPFQLPTQSVYVPAGIETRTMALILGLVGIYQPKREGGIRLAIGARVRDRAWSGGCGRFTRMISSLRFGVTPVDAAAFAAADSVLVVAALVAS